MMRRKRKNLQIAADFILWAAGASELSVVLMFGILDETEVVMRSDVVLRG